MNKVFVSQNDQTQQVGALFEPVRRTFSGLGSAVIGALKALPTAQVLFIARNSPTQYEVKQVTGDYVGAADWATAYTAKKIGRITSVLPTGATTRYAWSVTANGTGTDALPGPLATGVYSLEEFVNTLLDEGFDDDFTTATLPLLRADVGGAYAIVIDQANGDIWLLADAAAISELLTANTPATAAATFATEDQKWE